MLSTTKILSYSFSLLALSCFPFAHTQGAKIVDDSWADGGRDNGADALDTDWWTTTTSSAIEVTVGSLGLVSGTSGRGIRGTFDPQTLGVGDSITATYTFMTPATVGTDRSSAFRVALFDKLGRAGLEADLSASSGSPNPLYEGIPGYMSDFDINTDSTADVSIRKRKTTGDSGRLLATTSVFDSLGSSGDAGYTIASNTTYVGVLTVTRTGADTADIFSSLSLNGNVLDSHTETDASDIANDFGMLAFHANSNTFGSTTGSDPDNGIEFTNIMIEVNRIPEPTSSVLLLGALMLMPARAKRN